MGDGENLSGLELDPSKLNLYWMDFQWLGAGRVRFGVYGTDRIVCHSISHGNTLNSTYMGTATLPVRVEIFNTTNTASPSRLKFANAAIITEGLVSPSRQRLSFKYSVSQATPLSCDNTADHPLMSFRPAATLVGSIVNRKISIPELLSVYVKDQPVTLKLIIDGALGSPTFAATVTGAATEMDQAASSVTGGTTTVTWVLNPGVHNLTLPENFGVQGKNLILKADGTTKEIWSFTARSLETSPASVLIFPTWIDVS